MISNDDNAFLTTPSTEMEIKEALFSMHPDKSPGPDGMNPAFFNGFGMLSAKMFAELA